MHTFCADVSRQNQESFLGTASPVRFWLMIECPEPWGNSALKESSLTEGVKQHLLKLYDGSSAVRIQLIKKNDQPASLLNIFWADCAAQKDRLWHGQVNSYQELLTIDFADFISKSPTAPFQETAQTHFFICTNGKHDPCCAKYGSNLFLTVASQCDNVWQTTHLGGDRFAANVLSLPHGAYYRRVDQPGLASIIANEKAQKVTLAHFAGRSCYSRAIQAGECLVREKAQLYGWQDLQLEQFEGDENAAQIIFKANNAQYHCVSIKRIQTNQFARFTCNASEADQIARYELISYQLQ
ncbi:MAG: hypothetical protein HY817_05560 [Candidatus Abawacabacteria bacterium]|nr:hypothetical protein [Candidatus Abawacabacteria bacterium]